MKFAVLQFPGSNCDQDCVHVLQNVLGHPTRLLWHKESALGDVDAVLVPGGFSYGDYLRTGSIARFSPVMQAVKKFAEAGGVFDLFAKKFPDDALCAQALFWAGESYRSASSVQNAFRRYNRCRWDFPESEAAKYARGRLALPEMLAQFESEANSIDDDN